MRGIRRTRNLVATALIITSCTTAATPTTTTAIVSTTSTHPDLTTMVGPTPTVTTPIDLADTVLHNGKIVTVDDSFSIGEALAITGGDIVAVGSSSEMLARVGPDTVVVDLGGRTVLPGFVDPHTHSVQVHAFDSNLDAMRAAQQDLLVGGTTTAGTPTVSPEDLQGFEALASSGGVSVRQHLYLAYNDPCGERPYGDLYRDYQFTRDPDLRLAIAGVKIFSDGGVCNAPAFSLPYPETVPDRLKALGFVGNGSLYVTADEVAAVVGEVDVAGGITVIHSIGDVALSTVLAGLAQANDSAPFSNPPRIDHNSATSLLTPERLALYTELDLIPVVFSVPWANGCDPASADAWRAILPGPVYEIIEDSKALREANPDLRLSWHGDAPSIPGRPLQLMFTLVTGGAVDIDSGAVCYPDAWAGLHTVDVEEAIRMTTVNAAAAMGIEERVGSLEVGKVADLIVLENDIFGPDPETVIAMNRPLVTMIDGRVHFCEGGLCDQLGELMTFAPPPPTTTVVTASGSRDGHDPQLVLDGSAEGESFWSSGDDPPGWIRIDFDAPKTLQGLRFVVYQNPASETVHVLEVQVDGVWGEVETFRGFTTTGDILEWSPTSPVESIEGVRMTTTESLSWPEWYEIEVVDG